MKPLTLDPDALIRDVLARLEEGDSMAWLREQHLAFERADRAPDRRQQRWIARVALERAKRRAHLKDIFSKAST
jgi:hypothetical protein